MSWLSDIGDTIGSIFDSGSTTSSGANQTSIWPSLIDAGAGLAGTYFTLKGNKEANDLQMQIAKDKLAAELAKGSGGSGGGGGNAMALAKLNNLAAMYQNYANLTQKGGTDLANTAATTGKLGTDPIIARLGVLR
jgi:hypothetical protein